jgi:hypothetical protein
LGLNLKTGAFVVSIDKGVSPYGYQPIEPTGLIYPQMNSFISSGGKRLGIANPAESILSSLFISPPLHALAGNAR